MKNETTKHNIKHFVNTALIGLAIAGLISVGFEAIGNFATSFVVGVLYVVNEYTN